MSPEFIALMGGSCLLVYSVEELSNSAQYLAGSKLRGWLNTFSANRLFGLVLGIGLSVVLSSSGAVTVMLVGLANARLLTLEQVFSVTLGASIGSTLIVHLFAFRLTEYGLLLVAGGVVLTSFSNTDKMIRVGRGLIFTGLMFFSMQLVVESGKRLEHDELFQHFIEYFRTRPFISMLISTGITAVIHSSAATIGFVMSMMIAQNGSVSEAIPWVLGANLGTTTTAFFASQRTGILGKQAAMGNLLCKLVGVAVCYPFAEYLVRLSNELSRDVSRQIAHVHTLFNVFVALLFFPFIGWGVRLVRQLTPEKRHEGPFVFQYLDTRTLSSPELALAQAQREILRLSDTVEQMVVRSIQLFTDSGQRAIESVKNMDQIVDFLNKGIKLYLTRLSQKEMTPEQVQREFEFILRTNDLENIGDIVDRNILDLVRKSVKKGCSFSKEGWAELQSFHEKIVECVSLSTAYFNSRDRSLFSKLIVLHQHIEDLTLDLTEQHMQRLHRGVKETLDTTSVHLDLLGNLQRIANLAVNFTRVHGLRNEELTRIE